MNLNGKSVPQRVRDEAAQAALNEQRTHELTLVAIQGNAAGVAQAKETARQGLVKARWVFVGKAVRSPVTTLLWAGRGLNSIAVSTVKIAAKGAAVVSLSAGVAGVIDHIEEPNPDDDPTLVRVIDFGIQNTQDVLEHYELDEKASSVIGAFSRVGSQLLGREVQDSEPVRDFDWNQVPEFDEPLDGLDFNRG